MCNRVYETEKTKFSEGKSYIQFESLCFFFFLTETTIL